MKRRNILKVLIPVLLFVVFLGATGYGIINIPGASPATGCREGALMSTDAFTTTGFSQVRTVGPDDIAPAGSWVIADAWTPTTGVVSTPNCPLVGPDLNPLRVIGLRVTPTIGSWQQADIQKIELIQDNNCNADYEPGLDFVFQTKSGSELQSEGSITFVNGPSSPLFLVGPAFAKPAMCAAGAGAVGILAIVHIGPNPVSGTQFSLSLEATAADVPGLGAGGGAFSSGFSSSTNKTGSSIRLQVIGGGTGGPAPPGPPPVSGGSGLAAYDNNSDCVFQDSEFFGLIDAWLQEIIANTMFFLGVDAWIGQSNVCAAAVAASIEPEFSVELNASINRAYFDVRGLDVTSSQLEVYALNGTQVHTQNSASNTLAWNLNSSENQPVANGVYLYRITAKTQDGELIQSEVRKLQVLR
jgi:hypothetical protein